MKSRNVSRIMGFPWSPLYVPLLSNNSPQTTVPTENHRTTKTRLPPRVLTLVVSYVGTSMCVLTHLHMTARVCLMHSPCQALKSRSSDLVVCSPCPLLCHCGEVSPAMLSAGKTEARLVSTEGAS